MNMQAFILTEGSSNIGFGHITRCTSLYQAFEEKGTVPEFIVNGDETVEDLLKGKKHRIFNWLNERKRLFSLIKGADVVIIDSYLADYDFYVEVSGLVKTPIYIDDDKRLDYPEGIVVNGTVYAEEMDCPAKEGITYLLGSQYIPLRKEFWNVPEKEIGANVKSVMITFGGDDPRDMTPKVLRLLVDSYPELIKNVVIGKGFHNIEVIEEMQDNKTRLFYYPDANRMVQLMLESDVAISAGGQTLYELARIGLPTIAIAVAKNQLNNIQGWQKAGFIEYAGWWEDKGVLWKVSKGLDVLKDKDLRQKKEKTGRTTVDGLGAIRTVQYCKKKYIEENLVLKTAEIKDMYDIYKLSNEIEVRRNSFNMENITLESHKEWFVNKLSDKDCLFLVATAKNEFLGQVRFDINKNGDAAIMSISIAKKYRGYGVGKLVIQKAINLLRLKNLNIMNVKAYAKEGNVSSRELFQKSNFLFINKTIIKNQNALEYSYHFKSD